MNPPDMFFADVSDIGYVGEPMQYCPICGKWLEGNADKQKPPKRAVNVDQGHPSP